MAKKQGNVALFEKRLKAENSGGCINNLMKKSEKYTKFPLTNV
jgi:hypothetical protein